MLAIAVTPNHALADGGAGGSGSAGTGGAGGTSSSTGAGGTGGASSVSNTGTVNGGGGGGGGAGATGGTGGHGAADGSLGFSGAGGAGGSSPGAAGTNGVNGATQGAGGGGGGAHGYVGATLPTGNVGGGRGGNGGASTGGGGGGGEGGYGAVVTGGSVTGTISDDVTGGAGGNGGGANTGGTGQKGAGGDGGLGLQFTGSGSDVTIGGSVTGGAGGSLTGNGNQGVAGPAGEGGAGIDLGSGGNAVTIGGSVTGGNGGNPSVGGSTGVAGTGGVGIVGSNADVTVTGSGSVAGGFTGGGSSTQANAITFTGGSNTLTIESGYTITGNVVGTGTDTFTFGGTTSDTFDLALFGTQFTGFSTLGKTGTSTWTLTNGVVVSTLDIDAGKLTFATGSLLGSNADVASGATLSFNQTGTTTYGAVISGAGNFEQENAAGIVVFNSNQTYTGTTTITGTLQLGSGGTTGGVSSSSDIVNNGALIVNRSNGITLGDVSGNGTLTKQAAGTLTFIGDAAFSSVSVTGGGLQIGNGGGTGSIAGDIDLSSGTELTFNRTGTVTYADDVTGSGTLSKLAAGTLIFTGDTTFVSTSIMGGTLQIGNGGATGTIAGDIDVGSGAALEFNRSGTFSYADDITGAGSFTKSGAGTVIATGSIANTGGVTISEGTLQFDTGGALGSDADVASGATLSFNQTGTTTYSDVISGAGNFEQENAAGTVVFDTDQTYTGTTTINGTLQLGSGGTTGGVSSSSDIVNNGALVVNRSNAITLGDVSGNGTLTKQAAGTLTFIGDAAFSSVSVTGGGLQIGNGGATGSIAGDIALSGGTALTFNRTGTVTYADDVTGSGTLSKLGAGTLIFTGDTTFVSTSITAGTLQIGNGGATGTITGDIAVDSGAALEFNRSGTFSYADDITGGGSFTKSGAGTVIATGSIANTDGVTISEGTLQFDTGGVLGTDADVASGARLSFNQTGTTTYSGVISGAGNFEQENAAGTVVFDTDQTYTGTTTIAGTLQLGTGGTTGGISSSSDIVNNGALIVNRSNGITLGDVSGNGTLTKQAAGTLTFIGDAAFSSISVTGGGLQIGNGGATGTFAGDVSLGTGTLLNFTRSGTVTYAGDVSGDGSFDNDGTGTTILTGAFTNTGTFAISSGTVQIGDGGASGSVDLDIVNEGSLVWNKSSDYTYSHVISGAGGIFKSGSGNLILTGINTNTGDTTITAGRLSVNGQIGGGSSTTYVDGGVLGGTGTIMGSVDVNAGGIHAPGNSIGTQTISGSYLLNSGSRLQIEANAAGQSDRVVVGGTVNLTAAILEVIAAAGSYAPSTAYTIIDNQGSAAVNGSFAQITSSLAFLTPSVIYDGGDGNDVVLTLSQGGNNPVQFCSVAATTNQCNVANAVQKLGEGNPLYDAVLVQTAEGARQAFNAMSGEVYASTATALIDQAHFVRGSILDRLIQSSYAHANASGEVAALGAGGPIAIAARSSQAYDGRMALGAPLDGTQDVSAGTMPGYGEGLVFWTQAYGSWGQYDGNGNAATLDRSLGGFVSGVDTGLHGDFRAGIATGYTRTDLSVGARSSSSDVDSYLLAAYAGGPVGAFIMRSGATWSWNAIDATRAVIFPGFFETQTASYNGDVGQLFAEIAHPYLHGSTAIEPFAGLAWVHFRTSGFTETGGDAALTTSGSQDNVGYSTLGVRIAGTTPLYGLMVTPRASLAWQYAFGDTTPDVALAFAQSGTGFSILGVPLAQNSALIEAGIDLQLSADARLGISYVGQLAGDLQDNGVQADLLWRF